MQQFRKRSTDNAIAVVSDPQTKINLIEVPRQVDLIQTADFEEYLTTNGNTWARHCPQRARHHQLTETGQITSSRIMARVSNVSFGISSDAAVPQPVVYLDQRCTNDADVGAESVRDQFTQPTGVDHI